MAEYLHVTVGEGDGERLYAKVPASNKHSIRLARRLAMRAMRTDFGLPIRIRIEEERASTAPVSEDYAETLLKRVGARRWNERRLRNAQRVIETCWDIPALRPDPPGVGNVSQTMCDMRLQPGAAESSAAA